MGEVQPTCKIFLALFHWTNINIWSTYFYFINTFKTNFSLSSQFLNSVEQNWFLQHDFLLHFLFPKFSCVM